MRLPPDSLIAPEKVFRYLLILLPKGDKSAFLARAGYSLQNASQLIEDLRRRFSSKMLNRSTEQSTADIMRSAPGSPALTEKLCTSGRSG